MSIQLFFQGRAHSPSLKSLFPTPSLDRVQLAVVLKGHGEPYRLGIVGRRALVELTVGGREEIMVV